jgi:hypothetical protein
MTEWLNWQWVTLLCFSIVFGTIAYGIKKGNGG